jgi:hypothetical protein
MRLRRLFVWWWVALLLTASACGGPPNRGARSSDEPAQPSPVLLEGDIPEEVIIRQGEVAWAVYIAVGTSGDPAIDLAIARAREKGYTTRTTRLTCDEGATQAFQVDPREKDYFAVALYFETEDDANLVAGILGPPIQGIEKVRTLCLG